MSSGKKVLRESSGVHGRYSNYFKVGHNAFEFVLDFGQLYGPGRLASLHTRVITTPTYAKSLLALLQRSIKEYDRSFGTISEVDRVGQ